VECPKCDEYQVYVVKLETEQISMRKKVADQSAQIDMLCDQLETAKQRQPQAHQIVIDRLEWDNVQMQLELGQSQYTALDQVMQVLKREVDRCHRDHSGDANLQAQLKSSLHDMEIKWDSEKNENARALRELQTMNHLLEELEKQLAKEKSQNVLFQRQISELFNENQNLKVFSRIRECNAF
jgi:ribosome-associated translation inhibitor RaiA